MRIYNTCNRLILRIGVQFQVTGNKPSSSSGGIDQCCVVWCVVWWLSNLYQTCHTTKQQGLGTISQEDSYLHINTIPSNETHWSWLLKLTALTVWLERVQNNCTYFFPRCETKKGSQMDLQVVLFSACAHVQKSITILFIHQQVNNHLPTYCTGSTEGQN